MHGGSAPQVMAAAERRVAEQRTRELAARMDVDVSEFDGDPAAALRSLIARDQAEVERFGRLVAGFGDGSSLKYVSKSGVEQIRAEFAAYRAERESAGRRLELLLRADVAKAMLGRDEQRAALLARVTDALGRGITTVVLRHPEWGPPDEVYAEITGTVRATMTAWTTDHPAPERPPAA